MADFAYRPPAPAPMTNDRWLSSRSPIYNTPFYSARFDAGSTPSLSQPSVSYSPGAAASTHNSASNFSLGGVSQLRSTPAPPAFSPPPACNPRVTQNIPFATTTSPAPGSGQVSFKSTASPWGGWDPHPQPPTGGFPRPSTAIGQGPYQGRYSPSDSMDELGSPSLSDYSLDNALSSPGAPGSGVGAGAGAGTGSKPRSQRRPSNRDEFDGPHQFLKRPPPEYVAMQERDLPRLPTHLLVQEQDSVLNQVNERLSQCAYDFVAKYQFPIPLTQDMRPVERPQDREWTEWVYLLKRLATKRRIPARVLYNGQIKQFVTILENSLEMRHAAKHQSRPLKDDRNILQLISAGIQVAKILKDAQAMDYLDRLYVSTEQRIHERAAAAAAVSGNLRFR
ncbi:uncharacterized protein C8A04DRAFT_12204 [Dichotomopilus funicola]|uniref:Uncharacterized protein n=1 Tax=Dichotomopilus funicola TaxID=1934379 RepID=A0AAN6V2L1_9PEZI|nr:hypothetical protein C8A04DRAFT_12204 [Dichotomopilus funicola]